MTSLALAGLLVAAAPQPGVMTLSIERVEVVTQNMSSGPQPTLAVTVRNTGTQPIDAFGVEVWVTYRDGTTRRSSMTTDCRIEGRAVHVDGCIKPGDTSVIYTGQELQRLTEEGLSFNAQPSHIIFFDNSAVGIETSIEWSFIRRAAAFKTWEIAARRVGAPRAAGATPESILRDLAQDLDAERSINGSFAYPVMKNEIRRALAHERGSDPASYLASLTTEIPVRLEVTQAHAVRRPAR